MITSHTAKRCTMHMQSGSSPTRVTQPGTTCWTQLLLVSFWQTSPETPQNRQQPALFHHRFGERTSIAMPCLA